MIFCNENSLSDNSLRKNAIVNTDYTDLMLMSFLEYQWKCLECREHRFCDDKSCEFG